MRLPLQSFVSLTTLEFLKTSELFPCIIDKKKPATFPPGQEAHIFSKERIAKITEILIGACSMKWATAIPAGYCWGLMLVALEEIGSQDKNNRELEQLNSAVKSFQTDTNNPGPSQGSEQSLYEDLVERVRPQHTNEDQDSLIFLTSDQIRDLTFGTVITLSAKAGSMSATDENLTYCWIRLALLDVIRTAAIYVPYSPEIVEALLSVLSGPPDPLPWASTGCLGPANDPRCAFVNDRKFMDYIFQSSRSRFPYETVPFLKLCRSLVSSLLVNEDGLPILVDELESMNTFTEIVSPDFNGYETIREDENANLVTLTRALPMFDSSPHNHLLTNEPNNALTVHGSSEIPATAIGQIISESKPAVVMWQHDYSGLSYLGSWLESGVGVAVIHLVGIQSVQLR